VSELSSVCQAVVCQLLLELFLGWLKFDFDETWCEWCEGKGLQSYRVFALIRVIKLIIL